MESIFEAASDRRAQDRRRLPFSWGSFYAGVGVAMGMMLIAYKVLPHGGLAGLERDRIAMVELVSHVKAADLVGKIEAMGPARSESLALERLRLREGAPVERLDRDNAVLALVERSGKGRAEAQCLVDAWVNQGPPR